MLYFNIVYTSHYRTIDNETYIIVIYFIYFSFVKCSIFVSKISTCLARRTEYYRVFRPSLRSEFNVHFQDRKKYRASTAFIIIGEPPLAKFHSFATGEEIITKILTTAFMQTILLIDVEKGKPRSTQYNIWVGKLLYGAEFTNTD